VRNCNASAHCRATIDMFVIKQHVTHHQAAIDEGSVTVDGQTATVEARKGPRGRTPRTAQPTQPQGTSSSIYIRAVEPGVTREDVAGLFAPYGSVLNTQLRDSVNGRRYAFVQFEVSALATLHYSIAYVHVCVYMIAHTRAF
jgi:RNA recognition motif. (a.k.a. RRM, RBD, or RNP domain)